MKKIGIIGCGTIGKEVAFFIEKKLAKKAVISAICDKKLSAALKLKKSLLAKPQIQSVTQLVKKVDLVIETASQAAAQSAIKQALKQKKDVLILSVGALVTCPDLVRKAKKENINLYLPSGAIAGIDALGALAKGKIKKITLTTAKPPQSLKNPLVYKKNNKPASPGGSEIIFSGKVTDAVKYFPKNINVAATLFLASGFPQIKVIIKTDRSLKHNLHKIEVFAQETNLKIEVENKPSAKNPRTSALTILSTQYLLEKIFSSLKVGS